jgi:hypothetical protein
MIVAVATALSTLADVVRQESIADALRVGAA